MIKSENLVLEISTAVLESRIPIKFTLSREECAVAESPTFWAYFPRSCYLHSAFMSNGEMYERIQKSVIEYANPHIWFTFVNDHSETPIRTDLPLGVSTDLNGFFSRTTNSAIIELCVHFRNYPQTRILSNDAEKSFSHSVKQSLYVLYGSCNNFYSMKIGDRASLYHAVNTNSSNAAPILAELFPVTAKVARVAVRIVTASSIRQPLVSNEKTTLKETLALACIDESHVCVVQGIRVSIECRVAELWAALKSPDGWLYCAAVPPSCCPVSTRQ